ncbi:hypothetical protein [Microbispora sp. H10830]|uniref:hypothetical protein n=1 Tax=Microbispora sp. H10830 TaxID=2729109 RepID=UPI0015FFB5B5|nr:hypothetical protein [Microbispora sp. H10830]
MSLVVSLPKVETVPSVTPVVRAGHSLASVRSAVEQQFANRSGVHVSTKARDRSFWVGLTEITTTKGVYRFARSGISRSDITEVSKLTFGTSSMRLITIGRDNYVQVSATASIPPGKKWVHSRDARLPRTNALVEGLNPGFLQLVAPGADSGTSGGRVDGVPTILYAGVVTVPELRPSKAGILFGLKKGSEPGGRIRWRLWVGPDNLPRRFTASLTWDALEAENVRTMNWTSFYRHWGDRVEIEAPPRRLWVEENRHPPCQRPGACRPQGARALRDIVISANADEAAASSRAQQPQPRARCVPV